MVLDPQRVRFLGKVISASHALGASVEDDGASAFVDALYAEWLETGDPLASAPSWLASRLAGEFPVVAARPVWKESEAAWPFFEGKPMTFVSQGTTGAISPGAEAYLFAARQAVGNGFRVVYRVVSQFEDCA